MFEFKRVAVWLMMVAGFAYGQPALTTIQDILYRADGTRFNGTLFIHYTPFTAGDTSAIGQADLTVPIINGVLSVKLVPTTTASPGAQYNVTYTSSSGDIQFSQVWAVPPSNTPLRVRDVLVSVGAVVGPAPVVTPIQLGDVVGLSNALSLRPSEGAGFVIGRTAIINTSGQIDGASGNLSDCVHVDGSTGPCGGGGSSSSSGALFSDAETPAGTIDGSNSSFTLAHAPAPASSLSLYRNGVFQSQGIDYTISGQTIQFSVPISVPQVGDELVASYRYASPVSLTNPQVICSSAGSTTSASTLTQLGSCTIPAGLLTTGDRIELQFQYLHGGAATTFTGEIHWGSTVLISRSGTASDALLAGKAAIGTYASGQTWDVQSWGTTSTQATSVGTSTQNISSSVALGFFGDVPMGSSDSVTLTNFTVIRYPAQNNP